ncbi:zinc finger fyve/phd-type [Holotrichia oblita]|uniref:Zinc finger fyve/phd-type n=1 Tax=Holotrichia oblita TaxID=644536 RepID=A0ACB9ST33_HOLOL|nr:zinc finger fyve/phd-type [Holotrichia oblita]
MNGAIPEVMEGRIGYLKASIERLEFLNQLWKIGHDNNKTVILTSSPYKDELISEQARTSKHSVVKRNLRQPLVEKKTATHQPLRQEAAKKKTKESSDDSPSEDRDEETSCMYCGELYSNSKPGEGWIKCVVCQMWSHDACAHVEVEDDQYVCDFCPK